MPAYKFPLAFTNDFVLVYPSCESHPIFFESFFESRPEGHSVVTACEVLFAPCHALFHMFAILSLVKVQPSFLTVGPQMSAVEGRLYHGGHGTANVCEKQVKQASQVINSFATYRLGKEALPSRAVWPAKLPNIVNLPVNQLACLAGFPSATLVLPIQSAVTPLFLQLYQPSAVPCPP